MEAEESAAPKAGVCTDSDSEDQFTTAEDAAPDPNNQAIKAKESTTPVSTELAITAEESALPNAKTCFAVSSDAAVKTDKNLSKAGTPSSKESCEKSLERAGPKTKDRIASATSVVTRIPEENLNTAAASNITDGNFSSLGSQKSVSHEMQPDDLNLLLHALNLVEPSSMGFEPVGHTFPVRDTDSINLTDTRDAAARYERARPSKQNVKGDRTAPRRAQSGKPPNKSRSESIPDIFEQMKGPLKCSGSALYLENISITLSKSPNKPYSGDFQFDNKTERYSGDFQYDFERGSGGFRFDVERQSFAKPDTSVRRKDLHEPHRRERQGRGSPSVVEPGASVKTNDPQEPDRRERQGRGSSSVVEPGASVKTNDPQEPDQRGRQVRDSSVVEPGASVRTIDPQEPHRREQRIKELRWYRNTDLMVISGLSILAIILAFMDYSLRHLPR